MTAKMKHRDFITLIGGAAAAWPLAARAQQGERARRVGVLMSTAADDAEGRARIAAFLGELQKLGWIHGRNVRIDTRWFRDFWRDWVRDRSGLLSKFSGDKIRERYRLERNRPSRGEAA
jgi:hypothetical protein